MPITKNTRHDLKRKRQRVLEFGMILSLAFLVLAFKYSPTETSEEIIDLVFPLDDSFHVDPGTVIPPAPKCPIPISMINKNNVEDIEFCNSELDIYAEVDSPPPPLYDSLEQDEDDALICSFQEPPKPIGGIVGIQKRTVYPELAVKAGIEGIVFVRAFINEEGDIYKVEIIKGIGGGCDEAALDAVRNTKFIPVKQKEKKIKSVATIPIRFKLM